MKSMFARFGIPETVFSDNSPQYASQEFSDFSQGYGFHHSTSSPLFPQSNGQAERAVKTVKRLIKLFDDPQMALLTYQSTPFPWSGLSPAELLMGRCLRTNISLQKSQLIPEWEFLKIFRIENDQFKSRTLTDGTESEPVQHFHRTRMYGSQLEMNRNRPRCCLQPTDRDPT